MLSKMTDHIPKMACRYSDDNFRPASVSMERDFFLSQCILVSLLFYLTSVVSSMKLGFKEGSCCVLLVQLCLILILACSQILICWKTVFSAVVHQCTFEDHRDSLQCALVRLSFAFEDLTCTCKRPLAVNMTNQL